MKKNRTSIVAFGIVVILVGAYIGVYAASTGLLAKILVPADQAEDWVREMDASKATKQRPIEESDAVSSLRLYERSYLNATDEQKNQLKNIQKSPYLGAVGEYNKQILIIMGDLPEDTPQITLEQAKSICNSINGNSFSGYEESEDIVVAKFNEITGAPDFEGGSGVHLRVYFLNEAQTEYLRIVLGHVDYVNKATGQSETIFSYKA